MSRTPLRAALSTATRTLVSEISKPRTLLTAGIFAAISLAVAVGSPVAETRSVGWVCLAVFGLFVLVSIVKRQRGTVRAVTKKAMPLTQAEINERLQIWVAISELWLDNEMREGELKFIAQRLAGSKYSLAELEGIYLYEVAPVVHKNLRSVEGVQKAFPIQWLTDEILKRLEDFGYQEIPAEDAAHMTEYTTAYWERVKKFSEEYWEAGV